MESLCRRTSMSARAPSSPTLFWDKMRDVRPWFCLRASATSRTPCVVMLLLERFSSLIDELRRTSVARAAVPESPMSRLDTLRATSTVLALRQSVMRSQDTREPSYSDKSSSFSSGSLARARGMASLTARGCVFSRVLNMTFSIRAGLMALLSSEMRSRVWLVSRRLLSSAAPSSPRLLLASPSSLRDLFSLRASHNCAAPPAVM
mmetsp:Transcript_71060/g.118833  ORF Transcript_71060/g.118833 Transcript_71060/m.118833 type:complete len:205 (+) Transcript_71060:3037-3651(+)